MFAKTCEVIEKVDLLGHQHSSGQSPAYTRKYPRTDGEHLQVIYLVVLFGTVL